MKCEHIGGCVSCPYDYCLDEESEPKDSHFDHPAKDRWYSLNRSRLREEYKEKRAKGICIRCENAATHGIYCEEHYIISRKYYERQKEKKLRKAAG